MEELTTEKLLEKAENRFSLAIAAAKRARQLKDGAVPLVERGNKTDLTVALEEIMSGKIAIDNISTPEIIAAE